MSFFSLIPITSLLLQVDGETHHSCVNIDNKGSVYFTKDRMQLPLYLLIFDGVSLDSLLEQEQINEKLFPTFSQISKEWTWYRKAITNATSTIPARSMIYSGSYYVNASFFTAEAKENIFEKLNDKKRIHLYDESENSHRLPGFRNSIDINKSLIVAYFDISIPSPLRKYVDMLPLRRWRFDWRGDVPLEYSDRSHLYYGMKYKHNFNRFLKESTSGKESENDIYVLWSLVSHFPYIFDKDGTVLNEKCNTFEVGMDEDAIQKTNQNYNKALQYADSLLAIFINTLKDKGLYDDSIVIVISDHGMSKTGSNYDVNDDVVRIPFFVKIPGIAKGINDRDAELIDVAPTIYDIIGTLLPGEHDGQSILKQYQKRERRVYGLGRPGFWVLNENGKAIHKR
jgi:hypothetical protein